MGFWVRAASWTLGVLAVIVAGAVVYNAFFGPGGAPPEAAAPRVCPPTVSIPPRPAGAPVDEVEGLRPGFTVADAQAVLLCRDPRFTFDFESIWHTPVPASLHSRQRMFALRPGERLALGLVGESGREIAFAVFQDIQYAETAASPTPDAAAAALVARYGQPHDKHADPSRIDFWWLYAPDGKPIKPSAEGVDPLTAFTGWLAGNWNAANCERNVSLSPEAPARWSDQCGLTIHAQIEIRKEDATRIARYRVVAEDQARLGAAVEAYRVRIGVKAPAQ